MNSNKFMSFQESVIVFDSLGNAIIVKDVDSILVELPVSEPVSSFIYEDGDNPNISKGELAFLDPSSKFQLAKRSSIELKLRWKVIRGVNFSKRFYVNRFRLYKKFLLNMLVNFYPFINLFFYNFHVNFLHIKSFGFEFKCLEIVFNYSKGNFRIVYSSLIICFKFLFLEVIIVTSQLSIFPNPNVDRSFKDVKEFDSFSHLDNLSFTKLGSTIERVLDVDGELVLRSLYGGKVTKLEYRSEFLFREGLKFQTHKFYSSKGIVDKFSFRPVFNEIDLYSCHSVSSYYSVVPYKSVLSFNTGGRMSKSCKTFKSPKK